MINLNFEEKKIAAENWFKNLRNSICAEFEKIEYLKSKKKKFLKKITGKLEEIQKAVVLSH